MQTVTIREAKARWSDLMARAEAGEEIVLTRYGRPVVKIVRLSTDEMPRLPGGESTSGQISTNCRRRSPKPFGRRERKSDD